FPQFRLLKEEVGYFEPGAGFVRPEACIETQLALARKLGATIHTGETVLKLEPAGDSVLITTDRNRYSAARVILSAGPWIGAFLPQAIAGQLLVYRQVMTWFELARNQEQYAPMRFPVFIWITGSQPSDMFYGFPSLESSPQALKTATERYDIATQPDDVERTVAD